MNIERTDQEIYDLLDECSEAENNGNSQYPGMSYEQGIKAGIEWVTGNVNEHPLN